MDRILVGLDACHAESDKVYQAYNDKAGVTNRFYENGLENANRLLGYQAFRRQDWKIATAYDSEDKKHHAWYVALKDIETRDFTVNSGEVVALEESWKFPRERQNQIWREAGLISIMEFSNKSGDYQIHLLSPAQFEFKEKAEEYAPSPIPNISEWENLWTLWDTVTKGMVPEDELLNKPIKLRNDLIFYLGHIPAFADIHHTKATGDGFVEPASFPKMFERGIDPDVDDPSKCHDHSEIPDSWPSLEELTQYQDRIRARFVDSIGSGRVETDRRLGRAYWLAYEHEAMHLETFLYMLIQSNRVLAPPGQALPDFDRLASEAAEKRAENAWHRIPGGTISMGLEDAENDEGPDRYFGWDIERPPRVAQVKPFEAQSRPISNGEYALFLEETHAEAIPASWIAKKSSSLAYTNGAKSSGVNGARVASDSFVDGKSIRTVYGPIALKFALDWPVMASYDELARYARWANGRIPTVEEARTIYNFVERKMQALEKPGELISAVNG
jgi:L-histidine Nalpha-methyltransferase / hercynylcysteine S-oxide synthase